MCDRESAEQKRTEPAKETQARQAEQRRQAMRLCGPVTGGLVNLGPIPMLLYPHMYLCQLITQVVEGVPLKNDSQFQGQTKPGGI